MDRTAVGGGALPPKTFQLSRTSSGTVRVLLESLKQYKDLRDEDDSLLRERSQYQLREAEKYQAEINDLRKKLEDMTNESANERAKKEEALAAVSSLARTVSRLKVKHEASAQQSWNSSLRFADTARKYELQLKRIKPLLLAGLCHSNKAVFEICFTVLNCVDILNEREHQEVLDMMGMTKNDPLSMAVVNYESLKARAKSSKSRTGTAESTTTEKGKRPSSKPSSPKKKKAPDDASTKSNKSSSKGGSSSSAKNKTNPSSSNNSKSDSKTATKPTKKK